MNEGRHDTYVIVVLTLLFMFMPPDWLLRRLHLPIRTVFMALDYGKPQITLVACMHLAMSMTLKKR